MTNIWWWCQWSCDWKKIMMMKKWSDMTTNRKAFLKNLKLNDCKWQYNNQSKRNFIFGASFCENVSYKSWQDICAQVSLKIPGADRNIMTNTQLQEKRLEECEIFCLRKIIFLNKMLQRKSLLSRKILEHSSDISYP